MLCYAQPGKEKTILDSLKKYEGFIKKARAVLDIAIPPFLWGPWKNRPVPIAPPDYMKSVGVHIHQLEEEKYAAMEAKGNDDLRGYLRELSWSVYQNVDTTKKPPVTKRTIGGRVIYGFHPFWMGTAYNNYDLSLLTRVAYFSYSLDPATGRSKSPFTAHSWKNSSLQRKAHTAGCKVDLVVSSYDGAANAAFLGNANAQRVFSDSLMRMLNLPTDTSSKITFRGDGVTLDLQGMPADPVTAHKLTTFIAGLRKRFEQERTDRLAINLVLPIHAQPGAYEFDSLKNYVDLFIVCGYDYFLQNNFTAGPSSVLNRDSLLFDFTIDHSLNEYIDNRLPPWQIVLSLPWYAKRSITEDEKMFAHTLSGTEVEIEPYSRAKLMVGSIRKPLYDSARNASYYPILNAKTWEQTWMEDTFTLRKKYEYIVTKELAGVGIWSPGYATDQPEMWALLSKKFSGLPAPEIPKDSTKVPATDTMADGGKTKPPSIPLLKKHVIPPTPTDPLAGKPAGVKMPQIVPVQLPQKDYATVVFFCLAILTGFALLGFIIALGFESVREVVFTRQYFVYVVTILLTVGIILLLRTLGFIDKNTVVFIAGAVAGAGIIAVLVRLLRKRGSEEPTP